MPIHAGTDLKLMIREYFRRAYDEHDATVIDEMIAPDAVNYGLGPEPTRTREAFRKWYEAFRGSFSNVSCKVEHVMVEGEWVTCRIRFTATHTGDHLGPRASGKKVTLTALIMARIVNGKVVEGFNEFNQLSLLQQIGAM